MEHLALEVFDLATKENPNPTGSQYAVLEPDATITITDTSEIFADGDVWSYDFTLNVHVNAILFGTAGDIHGSRLHEQINKRKARLWVEGVPLYLGYLKLGDEAEVDAEGNVDVSFESGQKTFEEMIDGAKANQVPMMEDIQIGMALWRRRRVSYSLCLEADAYREGGEYIGSGKVFKNGGEYISFYSDGETESVQQYPHMVFPKGDFTGSSSVGGDQPVNCLNTDLPYEEDVNGTPTNPYCNVVLCYQKYGYEKKDEGGNTHPEYDSEPEAQRGYEYMPANRVNSAPNFFVIYWIRALMKHLGIHVEENQMMDVQDLRRLFFVNSRCAYQEPPSTPSTSDKFGIYTFEGPGRLIPEYISKKPNVNAENSGFTGKNIQAEAPAIIASVTVRVTEVVEDATGINKSIYESLNSNFFNAYASSDCFPDVDISEVIKAIESGFGIRFLFSDDYKRVRIVLLRNIFRSQEVQEIKCEIVGDPVKIENNIRGFRMTYGNTEDTQFYYKGFADKLPHKPELWVDNSDKHDYSKWRLDANYPDIIRNVTAFDKTCYVTPVNGNAFGIKIDKDAKRYDELHPSVFEYAGYMDAEDGDCTGNEETIETIEMGFTPAIMNDLNMEEERKGNYKQRFAIYVDETMRPRRPDLETGTDYNDSDAVYDVDDMYAKFGPDGTSTHMISDKGIVKPGEFAITSDMFASETGLTARIRSNYIWPYLNISFDIDGHINEGYRLYLQDNYEPNDDGVSPVEKHDWGLTLGIMRGSGDDSYVKYDKDLTENEEPLNDYWETIPGSSVTAHPDTCDNYGNEWDYNGGGSYDSVVVNTAEQAADELARIFPNSNAAFTDSAGYINRARLFPIRDNLGTYHNMLFVEGRSESDEDYLTQDYTAWLRGLPDGHSVTEMKNMDADTSEGGECLIVETDSSWERLSTLLDLCEKAYSGHGTPDMTIDNGIGSRYGRFSLKLRAEKPNPYFDPKQPESDSNRRYLQITNKNLQQRGLCDQFYKEYSYWIRNARIMKRTVRMTLAQLLTIDKTKRVRVGDVTGFIRKMQYSVSNETGLGNVVMEIMYI